jgi:hypothetical protein
MRDLCWDVQRADALRVLCERTGIGNSSAEPGRVRVESAELALLMREVERGLEQLRLPPASRYELRETPAGAERVPVPTRRGRPALPRGLERALRTLAEWLGPADAALALAICDAWPWGSGPDVRTALRRTEQRLSKLRRHHPA